MGLGASAFCAAFGFSTLLGVGFEASCLGASALGASPYAICQDSCASLICCSYAAMPSLYARIYSSKASAPWSTVGSAVGCSPLSGAFFLVGVMLTAGSESIIPPSSCAPPRIGVSSASGISSATSLLTALMGVSSASGISSSASGIFCVSASLALSAIASFAALALSSAAS